LQIIRLLREGKPVGNRTPVCSRNARAVCPEDLKQGLGDISSSKLSYHLKELKEEGFIREIREGKRIYYFLVPERFDQLVESIRKLYRTTT